MKIKKILNVLNLSIQKILILGMVFALTGGAIAYAQFYRTTSPTSGFSYGYGYDLSSYGYGYGYHSKIDSTGVYGFLGTDGSATIDSTSSAQTTIAVTYTTTYTATNTVEYGPSYGSSSTPTAEAAGSYTVSLTGLTCGTTYNIRVSSEDAGSNTWNDNATTASTSACSSGGGGGGFVGLGGLNNSNNNTGNNANEVGNGEGCTAAGAFSTTTGLRCPASVGGTSFNHNIEFGATDSDVRALQQYLNAHGFPVASSGAGSPGNETNYFGPATRAALAAFQAANDINPPAGYFGPITRAFINGQGSSNQQPAPSTFTFAQDLEYGMENGDVKELQKYLNAHGFPVASSGAGSPGNETNYFGPATRAALAAFQAANDINPPAGYFGPITRAFVNGN